MRSYNLYKSIQKHAHPKVFIRTYEQIPGEKSLWLCQRTRFQCPNYVGGPLARPPSSVNSVGGPLAQTPLAVASSGCPYSMCQVLKSSLLPPCTRLLTLSHIGFSFPTDRRCTSNFAGSPSRTSACQFCKNGKGPLSDSNP